MANKFRTNAPANAPLEYPVPQVDTTLKNYGQAADARVTGIILNKISNEDLGGIDNKSIMLYTDPEKYGEAYQGGVLSIAGFYDDENIGKYLSVDGDHNAVWSDPIEEAKQLIDELKEEVDKKQDILTSGKAILIDNDVINVKYDDDTVKVNGLNQLTVPGIRDVAKKDYVDAQDDIERKARILADEGLQNQIDNKLDRFTTGKLLNLSGSNVLTTTLQDRVDLSTGEKGLLFNDIATNQANGTNSTVFGTRSSASGENSLAEGRQTQAVGSNSHSEGYDTKSLGAQSHSEGTQTEAQGSSSHSEGSHAIATKNFSHAEGYYTITDTEAQHVQGKFNASLSSLQGQYADVVGWGTSESNRRNIEATTVEGDKKMARDVYVRSNADSTGGERLYWDNNTIQYNAGTKTFGVNTNVIGSVNYVNQQDTLLQTNIDNLKTYVDSQDNQLQSNINNLKAYVDTQDNGIKLDIEQLRQKDIELQNNIDLKQDQLSSGIATTYGGNKIDVKVDDATVKVNGSNRLYVPTAIQCTETSQGLLGLVMPDGTSTKVDNAGHLSVPNATTTSLGIVKVGDNLHISPDGTIFVNKATDAEFGVVQVDGKTIYNDGDKIAVRTDGNTIYKDANGIHVKIDGTTIVDNGNGLEVNMQSIDDRIDAKQDKLTEGKAIQLNGSNISVKIDDSTIKTNASGQLYVNETPYVAGSGITVAGKTISSKIDGTTLKTNANGELYVSDYHPYVGKNGVTISGNDVQAKVDGTTVRINANGELEASSKEYTAERGIQLSGDAFGHINNITPGTINTYTTNTSFGADEVNYDQQGHIASVTRHTIVPTKGIRLNGSDLQVRVDNLTTQINTSNEVEVRYDNRSIVLNDANQLAVEWGTW